MAWEKLNQIINGPLYEAEREVKEEQLKDVLCDVVQHHLDNCPPYRKLCDKRGFDLACFNKLEDLPYLPTSIFKEHLILSVPQDQVFREIHSSSTTTGRPSRVGLDRETSMRQTKCFNRVVLDRVGNKRRKFIVLDTPDSMQRSTKITARSSTIRSLLFCASEAVACVEEKNGELFLDEAKLDRELRGAQESGQEVVLFGFTYILYAFVVRKLLKQKVSYRLPSSKVLHIGGWKKLESEKVSPVELMAGCSAVFGIPEQGIIDFYGFTEQSGMIYPTCEHGLRHTPVWSDVIVRDALTLTPLPIGKEGMMQFITPIQTSYPGHSVLTEDVGFVAMEDCCPCGRNGKAFKIVGRARQSEIRGCGDIMADKFA
jgi:phenylacetate-coenzyme A ligase PaaK-like adenylate-forming protein